MILNAGPAEVSEASWTHLVLDLYVDMSFSVFVCVHPLKRGPDAKKDI